MSDKTLEEIKNSLEDIKAILRLANHENIDNAKKKLLKPKSMEEKIYNLCDGKRTIEDIAKKSGKSNDFVRATLSALRQKDLITNIEHNEKTAFKKIV